METSHLIPIPHTSRNDVASWFKSTHVGKCLLWAVGIILLVGSLIATSFLYSELGYLSFAIGGTGLTLGFFCFLLSQCCRKDAASDRTSLKYSQTENKPWDNATSCHAAPAFINEVKPLKVKDKKISASASSIRSRLPCKHEGNSCFVNSALQIMAHLTGYRNLFDKDIHKLEKGCQEEEACLSKRQQVQEAGNELMNCILQGKQAQGLEKFIHIVNNALEATGHQKFDIQAGGDAALLISAVETILSPEGEIFGFPSSYLNQLDQISEYLSQEKDPPKILVFGNGESCPFRSEIVLNIIGTYQLAAVEFVTQNHSLPVICSQSGQYFKLDDVVGRAEEISKDELSHILTNNKQSPSAYYIKVV